MSSTGDASRPEARKPTCGSAPLDPARLHVPDVDWETARPFWAAARAGELRLPRCRCGRFIWYPQPRCPDCRSDRIAWERVSGRARLFTWTTVYRSFLPGLADQVPYVTALVELEEDRRVRLATRLVDTEGFRLGLGLPLRVVFVPLTDRVVLPYFTPRGAPGAEAWRTAPPAG